MAHRDNVTALAAKHNITNDPGLREEDLRIAALHFFDRHAVETRIEGNKYNKASRLFFEDIATSADGTQSLVDIPVSIELIEKAIDYYDELWEISPIPGQRPLIDALRTARLITIVWKP